MKKFKLLKEILKSALDVFYPIKCCSCGEITENGDDICAACREQLEYINPDKRCKVCGKEKNACDCATYVHRYKELAAVFRYEGTAKRIMLRYKSSLKSHISDFFAKEMALCIARDYRNYPLDVICYVPVSKSSYNKRGFNQSKLIAKKLSKIFDLCLDSSLKIRYKRVPQHKSKSRTERLVNSRNKYVCKGDLTDKTVLLIDDISTTGATLDDCTRALLFAGAKEVYCAVAMVTSVKRDKR